MYNRVTTSRSSRLMLTVSCVLIMSTGCTAAPDNPGQSIYNEGVGESGRLVYSKGPEWLRMAKRGCAICHGDSGEGRTVTAGAATGSAPPLTRDALAARGYSESALRRAITEGVDPSGQAFDDYMPRWSLSESEFQALLDYLEQL